MRAHLLLLPLLSMSILAACDDKKTADPSAAPSATTATSASSVPAVPSAPIPSASAQPAASASAATLTGKRLFGCKTKVGDAKVTVDVLDAVKGPPLVTMKVDSKAGARAFNATSALHAATYIIVFSGYAEGDKHPAAEPTLVAGDTVLGRLVANGDKMEFYAEKGFPTHPAKDGPYICDKE